MPDPSRHPYVNTHLEHRRPPVTPSEEHWSIHNDGFKNTKKLASRQASLSPSPTRETAPDRAATQALPPANGNDDSLPTNGNGTATAAAANRKDSLPTNRSPNSQADSRRKASTNFSAQTYLRYQGDKFVKRFDANCYISTTRKLDTHDVSRGRASDIRGALKLLQQPTLVIGIESDGLFTYAEQQELAECIPNARLATIDSPEGHDAFLLQFEEVNSHIQGFLRDVLPDITEKPGSEPTGVVEAEGDGAAKPSVGEVDDITAW